MGKTEGKRETVVAITVTYNRTVTLKKCLSALQQQTRPVDEIIIVDNNSRQEEAELLKELVHSQKHVHLLCLKENTGGAGGFEAGMRAALEKYQADWYWIMDDDAYPRPDCLANLLEAEEKLKDVGFVTPLIYGIDFQEYQLYHHKYLRGLKLANIPIASKAEQLREINPVDANAFVGPLISKKAVELVGIADGSLFIYGDDTEYTYRITRKLKEYMIRDAVIDHQDPPLSDRYLEPKAWWKEYYSNRNRYFMIREFRRRTMEKILGYGAVTVPMMTQMAAALIKPKYKGNRFLRIQMLLLAVRDGMCNRRGKTIDPVTYGKMIAKRSSL